MINKILRRFGLRITRDAGKAYPVEAEEGECDLIETVMPYSMTSPQRLWSLISAVRYITEVGVEGDFVECGVWRGGSVMAMALQLQRLGKNDRNIWLYDTFNGMTVPTEDDVEVLTGNSARSLLAMGKKAEQRSVWCAVGLDEVKRNVYSTRYPEDLFNFVPGDVSVTLRESVPERISLLRLDTDWYESTRDELEVLYPRLAVGGICILDDYGYWRGARRAVDEYFACLGFRPLMHVVDFSGRIFLKTF